MAYVKAAKVNGHTQVYTLGDSVKKYTLKDLGFIETKAGNFSLERSLNPNTPFAEGFKLKLTVNKSLDGFKMAITTPNGLQKINIFKGPETKDSVEQFRFLMDNLITREVFKPI